jgi:hypothetical protein
LQPHAFLKLCSIGSSSSATQELNWK